MRGSVPISSVAFCTASSWLLLYDPKYHGLAKGREMCRSALACIRKKTFSNTIAIGLKEVFFPIPLTPEDEYDVVSLHRYQKNIPKVRRHAAGLRIRLHLPQGKEGTKQFDLPTMEASGHCPVHAHVKSQWSEFTDYW